MTSVAVVELPPRVWKADEDLLNDAKMRMAATDNPKRRRVGSGVIFTPIEPVPFRRFAGRIPHLSPRRNVFPFRSASRSFQPARAACDRDRSWNRLRRTTFRRA